MEMTSEKDEFFSTEKTFLGKKNNNQMQLLIILSVMFPIELIIEFIYHKCIANIS